MSGGAKTGEPEVDPGAGQLRRSLGLGALAFYGVGLILGAGIFSILGEAAGIAGEALWMSFLIGSLAALLTGLSYAELATMFPRAGAEYVYVREAWPATSWAPGTLGWVLVIASVAMTTTVALAFAGYATLFVGLSSNLIAAVLVVVAAALNVVGVKEGSWANVVFTLVEASGLVALIVVGAREPDFGSVFLASPHTGVLAAAGLIFFAYLGFEGIANFAEEAIHPGRDVPRAILIAVAVSTTLYVLVAAASVTLLDPVRLAASASPLADAMEVGAPRLAGALGGIALFATANTALISITVASRILLGMARGRDASRRLARTLARRKTPAPAILLVGAGAIALLPLGPIGLLGSVASLLALVAFGCVNAALIRLRFSRPATERPFRVPLALGKVPVLASLGLLVVGLLLTQFEVKTYAIALAALLIGCGVQAVPWGGRDPVREASGG